MVEPVNKPKAPTEPPLNNGGPGTGPPGESAPPTPPLGALLGAFTSAAAAQAQLSAEAQASAAELHEKLAQLPPGMKAVVVGGMLQGMAKPNGMAIKSALAGLNNLSPAIDKPVDVALDNGALVPLSEAGPNAIRFARASLTVSGSNYSLELFEKDSPHSRGFSADQIGSHFIVRDILAQMSEDQRAELEDLALLEQRIAPLAAGEIHIREGWGGVAIDLALTPEDQFDFRGHGHLGLPGVAGFNLDPPEVRAERITLRLERDSGALRNLREVFRHIRGERPPSEGTIRPILSAAGGIHSGSLPLSLDDPSTPSAVIAFEHMVTHLRNLDPPPASVAEWLAQLDQRGPLAGPRVTENEMLEVPLDAAWHSESATLVAPGTQGALPLRSVRIPLHPGANVVAIELDNGLTLQVDKRSQAGQTLLTHVTERRDTLPQHDPRVREFLYDRDLERIAAPPEPTLGAAGDTSFLRLPLTAPSPGEPQPQGGLLRNVRVGRSPVYAWADLTVPENAAHIGDCKIRLVTEDGRVESQFYRDVPLAYRKQIATVIRGLPSEQTSGHPVSALAAGFVRLGQPSLIATETVPTGPAAWLATLTLGPDDGAVEEPKLRPTSRIMVPFSALPAWAAKEIYDPEKTGGLFLGVQSEPLAVRIDLVLDAEGRVTPQQLTAIDETGVASGVLAPNSAALALANAAIDQARGTRTLSQHPALQAYEAFRAEKWRFANGPKPSEPHAQIVWRAAQIKSADRAPVEAAIEQQTGLRPRNWIGWINDIRELPIAESLVKAAAMQEGISPSFLYTVAIGEGFNSSITGAMRGLNDVEPPTQISGFGALGIDFFGAEAPRLRRQGYLPESFAEGTHYTPRGATNEKGEKTVTAVIVGHGDNTAVDNALIAIAAVLADRRDWALKNGKRILGEERVNSWSEAELNYVVYATFNAGQGFGLKYLNYLKNHPDESPIRKWEGQDFSSSSRKVHYNTALRIGTWEFLRQLHIFDDVE